MLIIPNAESPMDVVSWTYKPEDSDKESILNFLKEIKDEFDPIIEGMQEVVEFPFINPYTEEDVIVEIETEQYLNDLRVFKIVSETNYQRFVDLLVAYDRDTAFKLSMHLIERLAEPHK